MRNFIIILFSFSFTLSFSQTKHQLDSLTNVLEKIATQDQKYRQGWDSALNRYGINSPQIIGLMTQINLQDSINMIAVGHILDTYGWLGKAQISENANSTLFIVLQHAKLTTQLKYMPMMKKAVAEKRARPADYALLLDRTNMYQGKFQVYGSQLNYDTKGNLHIYPIIDEPNVNKRRKSVGLPTMQQYLMHSPQPTSYTLPKTDPYKNKFVIKGSINTAKENKPLPNVAIYTNNSRFIGMSDSTGFFQVLFDKKRSIKTIYFKKEGFKSFEFKLDNNMKQVIEINPELVLK